MTLLLGPEEQKQRGDDTSPGPEREEHNEAMTPLLGPERVVHNEAMTPLLGPERSA